MARTVADVLASARQTTNDAAGRRAGDAEMLTYVVDALNAMRNERPDLFLGNWSAFETIAKTDSVPIDTRFFRPLVDYVIARCESKDADHVDSARVDLMMRLAGGFMS